MWVNYFRLPPVVRSKKGTGGSIPTVPFPGSPVDQPKWLVFRMIHEKDLKCKFQNGSLSFRWKTRFFFATSRTMWVWMEQFLLFVCFFWSFSYPCKQADQKKNSVWELLKKDHCWNHDLFGKTLGFAKDACKKSSNHIHPNGGFSRSFSMVQTTKSPTRLNPSIGLVFFFNF